MIVSIILTLAAIVLPISFLLIELLKNIEFKDLVLLSVEISIVSTSLISIGASEDYSNLFLSIELLGFVLLLIGIFIFTYSYIRKYKNK